MQLSGKSVRLSNWPYYSGKTAKLVSISKPYWKGTQYWIQVCFIPRIQVRYELPFTDLTMLIRSAKYVDGVYQEIENTSAAILDLKFPEGYEPTPYPPIEKRNPEDEFECYRFGFPYLGDYYVLPLEVLVRDVLAPDGEMLHLMTSLDMKDAKFLCKMENGIFLIEIMSDIPYEYSKNREKMMHIAWIFSNPKLEKMFAQVFENIRNGNGILFDWCFDNLKCNVTYETNPKGTRFIKSITGITKRINAYEIQIDDLRDSTYEGEGLEGESEHSRRVAKDMDELISCGKGKIADLGYWSPNPVTITYEKLPEYVRIKQPARISGPITIYNGQVSFIGDGRRTTGDYTGDKTVPKLIFKQHDSLYDDSVFSEISRAFTILQGNESIEKVEYYTAKLSLHTDTGLFRYLDDGITERYYFAGKITFKDGKEAIVLDLQREKRNISMLMLIASYRCEWGGIIHEIMRNTAEGSGKWPTDILISLRNSFFFYRERCNHTNIGHEQLAKKILHKCHASH